MITISWPRNIKFSRKWAFETFLIGMFNRVVMGEVRYGSPNAEKNYMTRLYKEFRAYKRTGNREHLYNLSVYAFLESIEPENHLSHFNPKVPSVTRSRKDGI